MAKKKDITEMSTDEKLEEMLKIMRQINHRDRLRMLGGTFHALLSMIPLILFIVSAWYVYAYGDELLQRITAEAAKQASNVATGNAQVFFEGMDSSAMSNWFRQFQGQ